MVSERSFWLGRRVLVTGHTGFKGAWLTYWLTRLGATVSALALEPSGSDNLWRALALARDVDARLVDIRDESLLHAALKAARPQIIFHLAAQSLVRYGYRAPLETYATNVMGTVHLLEAARRANDVAAIVIVTSDKCYRNDGGQRAFGEDDPLGGDDPYSSSKAAAEIATAAYRASFGETMGAIASARAGNVIGGGDWAQDRLVPDIVRAICAGTIPQLRYPHAVRPWQHVLEPLAGYMRLGEVLALGNARFARAYNFGPDAQDERTVGDVTRRFLTMWERTAVQFDVDAGVQMPEAAHLTIDSSRARAELAWQPRFDVDTALTRTSRWYRDYVGGASARDLCDDDITAYESLG